MRFILCISFALNMSLVHSQYAMNLGTSVSPSRTISHKIGYTDVVIKYGSPSVKSRMIWGDLEPYDKVWRAGANHATTVTFSENVVISSQVIEKGTYTLFIIPKEHQPWIIILNKVEKQWGAFSYDESQDRIRIDAEVINSPHQEQLRYDISSNNSKGGKILMHWGKVEVGFEFDTILQDALEAQLLKNLEKASNATKWINYIQAAEILLDENQSLDTALDWINKAEESSVLQMEWHPQFYPRSYVFGHLYWTKAKVLAALKKTNEALQYAQKMKDIEDQIFFQKMNEFENIEEIINTWKKG